MGAKRKITAIGEIVPPPAAKYSQRAFLALLPSMDDLPGFLGVYREFTPRRSDVETELRLCRYDQNLNPFGLAVSGPAVSGPAVGGPAVGTIGTDMSRTILRGGEDPRLFAWQGRPCCSAIVWRHELKDWDQVILPLIGEKYILGSGMMAGGPFRVTHHLPFAGKNWAPVTDGNPLEGRLLFIRSLQPLCVLENDSPFLPRKWGRIAGEVITADPHAIGEFRCGPAARLIDRDTIEGYGHRTQTHPDRHTPFFYRVHLGSGKVEIEEFEIVGVPETERLIDPTAIIPRRGPGTTDRMVCSCCPRSWWHEQVIHHRVFGIED